MESKTSVCFKPWMWEKWLKATEEQKKIWKEQFKAASKLGNEKRRGSHYSWNKGLPKDDPRVRKATEARRLSGCYNPTQEVKDRISASTKRNWASVDPKVLKARNEKIRIAASTPEAIEKRRLGREIARQNPDKVRVWGEHIGASNKGQKRSPEQCYHMSEAQKGRLKTDGHKAKLSSATAKMWKDDEYVRKQMLSRNLSPNSKELSLLSILEEFFPGEYKFVGAGEFIVNGKCPDFLCASRHKLIELFGSYWHRGENPEERIAVFTPFGFSTIVVWEDELLDKESLKNRLVDFHNL